MPIGFLLDALYVHTFVFNILELDVPYRLAAFIWWRNSENFQLFSVLYYC